jgi:hypothetical protein
MDATLVAAHGFQSRIRVHMRELQEGVTGIEMQLEKQTFHKQNIVPRFELTVNNTFVFIPFTIYTVQ